ncbi:DUF2780 domain-containing protein [Rhodocyclaceae bacterium SMB388]
MRLTRRLGSRDEAPPGRFRFFSEWAVRLRLDVASLSSRCKNGKRESGKCLTNYVTRRPIMELIQRLVSELKVNEGQAKGGVGALLFVIRDQVAPQTFDAVNVLLPDAQAWMELSPERSEGAMGILDGIFGNVAGGKLDAFARLGGHFQSLGISPAMVKPFVETVLSDLRDRLPTGARDQIAKLHDVLMA